MKIYNLKFKTLVVGFSIATLISVFSSTSNAQAKIKVEGFKVEQSNIWAGGIGYVHQNSYYGLTFGEDTFYDTHDNDSKDEYKISAYGLEYIYSNTAFESSGFLFGASLLKATVKLRTTISNISQEEIADSNFLSFSTGYSWVIRKTFSLQVGVKAYLPFETTRLSTNGATPSENNGVGVNTFTVNSGQTNTQILLGMSIQYK